MMKLYDLELSGNCYKARLLFSLLGMEHEIVPVDFLGGEHKSPEFLKLNPLGEIPVLVDGDLVLRDSHAILVYIARRAGSEDWLPTEATPMAQVMQWISTDANEIFHGPNSARLHDKFGYDLDLELARKRSHTVLARFEAHLVSREWLELGRPTIADIACVPYLALAPEGGVPLDGYPAVQAWIGRIKALPGFVPMPGV
jgi:glutathione S-transferase